MRIPTGLLCLLVCLGLGACTAHAVRCDGPLQPINAPAAVQGAARHSAADHGSSAP
jgi:hypothetical protein